MERINFQKVKVYLTVLTPSCTARTWTSMRRTEAHRRALLTRVIQTQKNMERKINTKKKHKKKSKEETAVVFPRMRTVESCSSSQDWLYICLELSRDITDGIKIMLFTLPYRLESRYLTASYSIMKTRPWSCMLVVIPKCFYTWDVGLVRFLFLFFFF